ncbi:sensor histidine kinase [Desertihabitans aurantiacus]|uniref:sensor histidine kinase n=1 Tax=Desertihabitans aurantiacus TaxID=2282477 RepID=UPI000DF7A594|nr:HAMP domain-containing sensor histidine kinase [Desertihabitans aurantiacus]
MARPPGTSVRLRLTLSYAALVLVAGVGLIAVVWVFLLRYVPEDAVVLPVERVPGAGPGRPGGTLFIPGQSDLWEAFAPKAALMLALLLVLGLVGGWFLAGRMLAPVQQIAAATRRAGSGSLSHRIELPGRRDEFRELADAFDGMLARLESHVAEQRRFAANASHELRTPLTITQTLLDVARRDPDRVTGELVQLLADVNTRAIDLTEALLLLSRAEQSSSAREPVDLSLAAEEAVETLLPLAERRGTTLEVVGDRAPVVGSPALLLQMTTNLVHNAIVHNLPEGGRVAVRTGAVDGGVELTVENTGAELPAPLVGTLTEPFQRGEGRTAGDSAGVGLGLAIVQTIVTAHDGTLTLRPRPGGGLCVTVRLPADPAQSGPRTSAGSASSASPSSTRSSWRSS